jgi:hypothetical protein
MCDSRRTRRPLFLLEEVAVTRRRAVLSLLATTGSAAAVLAPMAHASTQPRPCPVVQLVHINDNGSVTVNIPASFGHGEACYTSVTVPPPAHVDAVPTHPIACPVQPLLYESNGVDYLSIPDPSGQKCRDNIPLPIYVPPS